MMKPTLNTMRSEGSR